MYKITAKGKNYSFEQVNAYRTNGWDKSDNLKIYSQKNTGEKKMETYGSLEFRPEGLYDWENHENIEKLVFFENSDLFKEYFKKLDEESKNDLISVFDLAIFLSKKRGNLTANPHTIFEKIFDDGLIKLKEHNFRNKTIFDFINGDITKEDAEELIGDISHILRYLKKRR